MVVIVWDGGMRTPVYSENNYASGLAELIRFVRNIHAHSGEHGFRNEGKLYQWIRERLPWFWPVLTVFAKEEELEERLKEESCKSHVEIMVRIYNEKILGRDRMGR